MRNATKNLKKQIQEIRSQAKPQSRFYGKLLRWKQSITSQWNYGIGLSDTHLFDTGEAFEVTDKYQQEVIRIVTDSDTVKFSPNDVVERLVECLYAFDDNEHEYDKRYWNDEHLARLVATNKAISFNNKEEKENLNIKKEFKDHLINESVLDLNPRPIGNTFPKSIIVRLSFILAFFLGILISDILELFQSLWWGNEEKGTPGFVENLPLPKEHISVIFSILALLLLIFIFVWLARFFVSISSLDWSGFRGQKLWNWLDLLIVPVMLALGAFFLNLSADQRQNKLENERKQQETLKSYFSQVKDMLIKDSLQSKIESKMAEKNPSMNKNGVYFNQPQLSFREKATIEALTSIVLRELDEKRKRQAIKFLAKSKLITYPECNSKDKFRKYDNYNKKEFISSLDLDIDSSFDSQISMSEAKLNEVDLSSLDLSCINFTGTDLSGTKFDNSIFFNTNFSDSKTTPTTFNIKTSFKKANLQNSQFDLNILYSEKFKKTFPNSLKNILQLKSLIDLDAKSKMRVAYLKLSKPKSDFNAVNLQRWNFDRINFNSAQLTNSDLQDTEFINSILDGVDFTNSDLRRSKIHFSSANKVDFSKAYLDKAILKIIMLREAIFDNAILTSTHLSGSNLTGAKFRSAKLLGTQLDNSILVKADFTNANLESANFKGADLSNAIFKGANLLGADLLQVKSVEGADFNNACYNIDTKLPHNFNAKEHQMKEITERSQNPCYQPN